MIEFIGILAICAVAGYATFIFSMKLSEDLGWWRSYGLGAIPPMLAFGFVCAALVSGGTYWFLTN